MKNIYISTIFLVSAFTGFAQITITKTDILSAADTIRMSRGATSGIPDPKLTGANYTWDYSSLTPTIQYVDSFCTVASTPAVYQFFFNNNNSPNYKASFAQRSSDFTALPQIQLTNRFNYYKNSTTEFSIVGFGSTVNGLPLPVKYDTTDVVYKFPLNYGTKDSSISKYVIAIPTLGYYGQRTIRVNEVEGWGTIKTPYGTFAALKIKSTLYKTDTIFYTAYNFGISLPLPKQYEYKWLATGKMVPVLEIDSSGSAITRVVYRDSMRAGVKQVGMNEIINSINLSVYPNPATESISVSYSIVEAGNVKLELLDIYGRSVETILDRREQAGMHFRTLSVPELNIAKGVYFMRLSLNGNAAIKKLIVQ